MRAPPRPFRLLTAATVLVAALAGGCVRSEKSLAEAVLLRRIDPSPKPGQVIPPAFGLDEQGRDLREALSQR